jgi:outer membrane protein insertion porin family
MRTFLNVPLPLTALVVQKLRLKYLTMKHLTQITIVLLTALAGCSTTDKSKLDLNEHVLNFGQTRQTATAGVHSPSATVPNAERQPEQQPEVIERTQQQSPTVTPVGFNTETSAKAIIRGQDFGYAGGRLTNPSGQFEQNGPMRATDATSQRPAASSPTPAIPDSAQRVAQVPAGDPYFSPPQNVGGFSAPPQIPGSQFPGTQNNPGALGNGTANPQPNYAPENNPNAAYSNQPYGSVQPASTVYGPSNSQPFGQGRGPAYGQVPYSVSPYDQGSSFLQLPPNFADINAIVSEGQSGQIMLGAAINSDAGLTGQLTISEKNFDIMRFPRSPRDLFIDGNAFRGAGQGFRLEAMPGNQVQRYLLSFTEPYLLDTQISLSTSAYYFTRQYRDYDEQRLGGRISFGYRLTPDLSLSAGTRMENVNVANPRVNGSNELNNSLGNNALMLGQVTLTHDTRDHPFLATEGHYLEIGYQQAFGQFDYPRGDVDYRRYFLIRERPDGSGRHTLSVSTKLGITGPDTPIFENYFAGGFSTMRGFNFRGASPVEAGVQVGGELSFLNSVEYMFPLSPDDMIRGVVFCDFGTVEEKLKIEAEDFRVAPGFGFRINMPFAGSGGAPLAFDFAFPVAMEDTDSKRMFSFYFGVGR